jgi:hypothetical protein
MKRPTYASCAATIALIMATGGTAVAAHRYVISSSRQIKPGAIAVKNLSKSAAATLRDAQTLQGHPAAAFVPASSLLSSGRIAASEPNNSSIVEKLLVDGGTFRLYGECERNNVGTLQTEVWIRSTAATWLLDSFGNGTDGALARSQTLTSGGIGVLAVVPDGRYDSRTFAATAPNGGTLTGIISAATNLEGDCVFTATAAR